METMLLQERTIYLDAYVSTVAEFGDCNGDALDASEWSCGSSVDASAPTAVASAEGYCLTLLAVRS